MDYQNAFAISSAGMAVERLRVEVSALNLANANTVADVGGTSFQPLRVIARAAGSGARVDHAGFASLVELALAGPEAELAASGQPPRRVLEPGQSDGRRAGLRQLPRGRLRHRDAHLDERHTGLRSERRGHERSEDDGNEGTGHRGSDMSADFIAATAPIREPASTGGIASAQEISQAIPQAATADSFGSLVVNGLEHVNTQLQTSQVDLQTMASGQVDNLHQIMIRMEEARLSFQLMLQVRNRLLESYQDVMRMQV